MTPYESAVKKRALKQFASGIILPVIVIGGWFYPLLGFFIPLCMFAGMGVAAFRGRAWCDWYCPRGSFYDAWIRPISPQREIPAAFRGFQLRFFVLLALMAVMAVNVSLRWPHPNAIAKIFVTLLTITTVLGIVLAVFIHSRSWCMVCPIGTVSKWIGAGRRPLSIDAALCIDCKRCGQVCPIQIRPYAFKNKGIVQDGDCLKCDLCIAACPKQALRRN